MFALLASLRMCVAITATWPEVPAERACPAAVAITVTHGRWSPTLIAAIAYHETGFSGSLVGSRGECGPMQVAWPARKRVALCDAARADVFTAYAQGVGRLDLCMAYCGGGDGFCALNVYAAGPRGRNRTTPGEAQREFLQLERALILRLDPMGPTL
jgi:hypothetical protein